MAHSYLKTPVYQAPMTEYLQWRRLQADERYKLQESMARLATSLTKPAPSPLEAYGGSAATTPVISRPRKSTLFLQRFTTPEDQVLELAEKDADELAADNKFLQPPSADKDPDRPIFGISPAPAYAKLAAQLT